MTAAGTNLFAGSHGKIFIWSDTGASWTTSSSGLNSSTWVNALTAIGSAVFAGADSGVYISTDIGGNWTRVNDGWAYRSAQSFATSGMKLFAGSYNAVLLTTDNGATWTQTNFSYSNLFVRALAIDGSYLYAGTDSGRVLRSTNDGGVWTSLNGDARWPRVQSIVAHGSDIYVGSSGSGVHYSSDGGVSWTQRNSGLTNTAVNVLLLSGSNLYAGTDGGAFFSADDGTNWTPINAGLMNTSVRTLMITGSAIFAGTNDGIFQRPLDSFMSIVFPRAGINGLTNPIRFTWRHNSHALTYAFQVAKDTSFSNPLINEYTTDTAYTVSNLDLATTYYWRVRAENVNGPSEWALSSFTMKLLNAAPQLLGPADGATLVSVTLNLHWSSLASAVTYTLQVATEANFDSLAYWRDTTGTSVTPPSLRRGTLYFWRVRAQLPGDTSAWSSVFSFSTIPNAPAKIALVYPDSGKQDTYENDWFVWRRDSAALSYHIDISPSPLFTTIFDSVTTADTGYRNPGKSLTPAATYFWRVRASNLGGVGEFSSVWLFKVANTSRVPAASYSSLSLDFGRVKVGEHKDTVLTVSNTGTDTLRIQSISSSTGSFSVSPTTMTIGPGQSSADTLRYSPASDGSANAVIVLIGNAASSPDSITVTGYGLLYELTLSTAKLDMGLVLLGGHKDTTITIFNTGAETLRVSAVSSTAPEITVSPGSLEISPNGFASDTIHFAPRVVGPFSGYVLVMSDAPTSPDTVWLTASGVNETTGIERDGVPLVFALEQNYPNPFNPSTTIAYELPKSAFVSLRIYSTLGQLVATLVDGQKEAGYHHVQWNPDVPSGTYFCRLQAGGFIETKKMILLR
jgi:hypothetical protein